MRILLIKLSSLGDIFHTFPALSEARIFFPDLQVDWIVEESFAGLAVQHPAVNRAFPVRLRKILKAKNRVTNLRVHWRELRDQIAGRHYDLVIDAQGLLKSAVLTRLNPAPVAGFGFGSAREFTAPPFYQNRIQSNRNQHAIRRTRQLFAGALGYELAEKFPGYGLKKEAWNKKAITNLLRLALPLNYVVFLHGAAWTTKTWPVQRWRSIAATLNRDGVNIFLPWGNREEHERAETIANGLKLARVLPSLSIVELAHILSQAQAVIGVDSGLGHIPVAFGVPGLVMIGPTDAAKIGHQGPNQVMIKSRFPKAPCNRRKCKLAEKSLCCMAAIGVKEVEAEIHKLLITGENLA